jgi:hypothetical protein
MKVSIDWRKAYKQCIVSHAVIGAAGGAAWEYQKGKSYYNLINALNIAHGMLEGSFLGALIGSSIPISYAIISWGAFDLTAKKNCKDKAVDFEAMGKNADPSKNKYYGR